MKTGFRSPFRRRAPRKEGAREHGTGRRGENSSAEPPPPLLYPKGRGLSAVAFEKEARFFGKEERAGDKIGRFDAVK
jgi:hypothetical protein